MWGLVGAEELATLPCLTVSSEGSVEPEAVTAAPCFRVIGARMVVLPRANDEENLFMRQNRK